MRKNDKKTAEQQRRGINNLTKTIHGRLRRRPGPKEKETTTPTNRQTKCFSLSLCLLHTKITETCICSEWMQPLGDCSSPLNASIHIFV